MARSTVRLAPEPTLFLTRHQAAARLGVSLSTFDRRLAKQIPSVRVGGHRKWRPEAVDRWIAENEVAA